jgi:adenylylsulfate kinase-like enzyme
LCLSARNRKRKNCKRLGRVQPKSSSVWHTGLSGGAPDSVRCARLASGELASLGKNRRRTAIIHRTIWWCTGLSGEPTVASATVDRAIRGRRVAHANGRQGSPDCPVRQLPRICKGRLRQNRKENRTGPSTVTVRWCTGLSGAPPDRRQLWPSLLASNGS